MTDVSSCTGWMLSGDGKQGQIILLLIVPLLTP